MATYEQLTGAISIASNSPTAPTGYGVQVKLLVERLKRAGLDPAILSNYGLEAGMSTHPTPYGDVPHYPRGVTLYSGDIIPTHHKQHLAGRDIPNAVLTLYDAWVFIDQPGLDDLQFWSWTPVDHITLPPKVRQWAEKPNVKTIAMSPFGQAQFEKFEIDSTYIPHAVDGKVYKPTDTIRGMKTREFIGIPEDAFLVGMVAANKANGSIHRKAFAEQLLAFTMFSKDHPDAYLYIHTEPGKHHGGFGLINLIKALGLSLDRVLFPDPVQMRYGYPDEEMAALYSTMDVLLHASYGEGFGVPAVEAQMCGTRVIGSNWTATPDVLGEDSYLVEGQPFWDEAQLSFFQIPLVPSLISALKESYKDSRGTSLQSVKFAKQFEIENVWNKYWMPYLKANL